MKQNIGFIGLGIMGFNMASHLIDAGYDLYVYDIDEVALKKLVDFGANACKSSKEVAEKSNIVISMVPDSPNVEEVCLSDHGIINGAWEGLIYIDMSTISPATSVKVADRLRKVGVRCLDAPVSGGESGAKNANLSIMVGGSKTLFNEVLPILEVMGTTITLCGENGAGQIVKACNQIQVALNFIGMAEAFVLGAKANVDPNIILQVLSGGYAQCRVMDVRGPKIIMGDFEPGFKSKFHYKDLNIIMETAREYNVPLPTTAIAHELFNTLINNGGGDLDHSAVIKVIENMANFNIRTRNIKRRRYRNSSQSKIVD